MSRAAGKVRRDMVDADRTSNLPVQVLDLILSYLPLRDIVRTSILSTDWRYSWATAPKLVFDRSCCSASWKSRISDESEALARIIDHVLLLHTGPIEVLEIKDIRAIPDIDRWVLHVSRQLIRELALKVRGHEEYRSPSSLHCCESLVKLKLSNCILSRPSSIKGFQCLKCLCLEHCTWEGDVLANLISSCPLLEKLTLDFMGAQDLKIDAQNLQCVEIRGTFDSITFGCAMARLSNVVMDQHSADGLTAYVESGLTEFFINLPSIQRLEMRQWFLKHLAVGLIPSSLPFHWKDMYHLFICLDFCDPEETSATLCLLNSSPNLTKLETESYDEDVLADAPSVFADGSKCCCKFEKLRQVKMSRIDGLRAELEFIKLVLANSPVLEKMTLVPRSKVVSLRLKDMLRFKRLSPEAEIIYDP